MLKTTLTLVLWLGCVVAKPTVIVIGAGPSGIAAATRLLEKGVEVTILEAEPRIGGRVHSAFFGQAYVDIGAEWCHGEVDNIVYGMVKDLGVLASSDVHFQMYSSDRRNINEKFTYELHEIFDTIYTPDGDRLMDEGVTVGEYFLGRYNATVQNLYGSDPKKLDFSLAAIECFHRYVLSSEGAFSWFDTSAVNDYRDCEGDLNLNWNGRGYKTILDVLMKKFPVLDASFPIDEAIKLNSEVRKIMWDRDGVTVLCTDQSNYTADYLIFTPSLGVLKSRHMTLFTPRLPLKKKRAIRDIGIGAVMKVMMHFPIRFWPKDNFTGFSFVWTKSHRQGLVNEYPHGPSKNGKSWLEELFGIYRVEQNPNVLSTWFSGDLVPEIEKMSDEAIINGTMFMLNRFMGHQFRIVRPNRIMRSSWYSNPHFRGTYSYQTIASRKTKPSANLVLAEPLYTGKTLKVLFAGEATHPHYYSTVHGAIESGFRAATEAINYMKMKDQLKH